MRWLRAIIGKRSGSTVADASAHRRALELIAAIDAGGVPLFPGKVNDIARQLGIEVSAHDKPEDTIARIRRALRG